MAVIGGYHYLGAGTVTLIDGTPTTPLECEVDYEGAFSAGPLPLLLHEDVDIIARSRPVGVVPGAPIFVEGSFTGQIATYSDVTNGTINDFLDGRASTPYADRVSTVASDSFFHCNVKYANGSDTYIFADCLVKRGSYTAGDPSLIEYTFKCRGNVTHNGVVICAHLS